MTTTDATSNVYCVKFKPGFQYNIVLGTADHNLYYFDLHNIREPCTKYNQFDFLIRYSIFAYLFIVKIK